MNVKNYFKKNSKGFTLIEILVVTTIIAILTTATLLNYRNISQQFALQRATNKLFQDLRRMQEMAMASEECKKCSPVAVPKYGYGIRLETSSVGDETKYIIFAHNDPEEDNYFYNPTHDTIIETILLEKGVIVYEINHGANPHVSVNIRPPLPATGLVCLYCGKLFTEEIEITLALEKDTSKTKEIYVNTAGLIYVK